MKKVVVIISLLVLVFTLCAFTGCSGDESYDLWIAGLDGGYGTEGFNNVIREFERIYEAKTGSNISIKKSFSATIENDITSPLNVKAGPDVVYLASSRQAGLTESMYSGSENNLFRLNDLLEKNVYNENVTLKDKIMTKAMGNNITNPIAQEPENHYLLPLAMGSSGLYFNGNLFTSGTDWAESDSALLSLINNAEKLPVPETMQQFLQLGKQLNVARNDGVGKDGSAVPYLFTYPTPGYFDTMIPSLIASNAGQDVLTSMHDYGDGVYENASVKKVYADLAELADYCEPSTLRNGNDSNFRNNQQLVMLNKALFQPNGNWVIGEMGDFDSAENFEWSSMAFPGYSSNDTIERYGKLHYEQIWLPKNNNTSIRPIVEDFMLFLYSRAGQSEMSKGNGMLMPTVDYLDAGTFLSNSIRVGAEAYYSPDFKEASGAFKAFEPFTASGNLGGGQMDAKRFKLSGWCGGIEQILKAKAGESSFYSDADGWTAYNETINDEIRASL